MDHMHSTASTSLLGAHVSIAGGIHLAPAQGRAFGATAIQIFTKTPNRWRDPAITATTADQFRKSLSENDIRYVVGHDSYLINLASPDPTVSRRSIRAFHHELERCHTLGVADLVSHPGNYIDDQDQGEERNALRITECLQQVPGVRLLLETTAGAGTALGANFGSLARIRSLIGPGVRDRVGFCADTCHLYSAGYDLKNNWDGVWEAWERRLGLDKLWCLHLNDSKTPLGSRRDRHELIGEGSLGPEPFRQVMRDPRLAAVPKILETPKGEGDTNDRKMLRRLRAYARGGKRS